VAAAVFGGHSLIAASAILTEITELAADASLRRVIGERLLAIGGAISIAFGVMPAIFRAPAWSPSSASSAATR
jgi:uncharacterized membrane protein HdeD (DUF308 family)